MSNVPSANGKSALVSNLCDFVDRGRLCSIWSLPALVNAQETGFAQVDFTTVCPHCNVLITRETMGVSKFIKDIILDPKDNAHVQIHGKGVYLP